MKGITPCLWFDSRAEEAAKFYCAVFKDSKMGKTSRYTEGLPGPEGSVLTVTFQLQGQEFMALNGGPEFRFSEAVSFIVNCESQKEIDEYWSRLISGGGEESMCGWLKDKFGLSWQIVPIEMEKWITDPDRTKVSRVMQALMKMKKLDVDVLKKAYEGR